MSQSVPKAFISYTWDSDPHKRWVKDLAARLRSAANVDVAIDDWEVRPGDQIPHFMETAIREADFVLCICTPRYKVRFDARQGGAGYEANLMSAEALATGNERKFIGLLREGEPLEALPSWLLGKRFLDFRGDPYDESSYESLVATMYGLSPQAPPISTRGSRSAQLQPTSVARQDSYAEFLNAALKVVHLSQSRLILRTKNNEASRVMLPSVESELEKQLNRVTELVHTYTLQSSDEVKKAAGPIAVMVGMMRMFSWHPMAKQKFDDASATVLKELIPKFVEATRREGGLR
jgi:hypothetical protein